MEGVNEILPGVAGAAGTGAAMIVLMKVFLNHWLKKSDKAEDRTNQLSERVAVLETKTKALEKDVNGLGATMRREIAALQK